MALWDQLGSYLSELTLSEEAERAMKRGDRALKDRDYAGALVAYREGIRREKDYAPLHLKAGIANYFIGDQEQARACLCRAMRYKSDLPEAELWLGMSLAADGNYSEALSHYRRAKREGYTRTNLHVAMGKAYLATADPKRAKSCLQRVIDKYPGDKAAIRLLSRALIQLGEDKELCTLLEREKKRGLTKDMEGTLAFALCRVGRFADSKKLLEKMMAKSPDDGRIFAGLGLALLAEGDDKGAEGCLQQAVRLSPEAPLPAFLLASLLVNLGRLPDALGVVVRSSSEEKLNLDNLPQRLRPPGEQDPEGEPLIFGYGGQEETDKLSGLRAFALSEMHRFPEAKRTVERLTDGVHYEWLPPLQLLVGLHEPEEAKRWRLDGDLGALRDYALGAQLLRSSLLPRAADAFRTGLARVEARRGAFAGPIPLRSLIRALEKGLEDTGEKTLAAEVAGRHDLHADEARIEGRFASLSEEVISLLNRALVLVTGEPEMVERGRQLTQLREDYDRPLLVTIMGEFNTGKSSFINAFIGEAVAPMGIIPTTATINYLKYGTEKALRILYRDGDVEERPINELASFVDERKGEKDVLRGVDVVEILYPLEILKSVNIVDTPGLNAPIPEHEKTTRDFLDRSDAVLWLFSATQAGKASEREVLDIVKAHSRKAIGVVNKIDKVSDEDKEAILGDLRESFAGYFASIGAVSARTALRARQNEDEEQLKESLFPELERVISKDIFSQSRAIKDEATVDRFRALLKPLVSRRDEIDMAARSRELELEKMDERIQMRKKEFLMTAVEDLNERMEKEKDSAIRSVSRDLVDLLETEHGLLGSSLSLSAGERGTFVTKMVEGLHSLVEESFEKGLASSMQSFESELEGEWETFLEPVTASFPGSFQALVRPWLRTATRDLEVRLLRGIATNLHGALEGGLLRRIMSRLEQQTPSAAQKTMNTQVERAYDRALEVADDIIQDWADIFFSALQGMREETSAALRELDIEKRVGFWDPLVALFERAESLQENIDAKKSEADKSDADKNEK